MGNFASDPEFVELDLKVRTLEEKKSESKISKLRNSFNMMNKINIFNNDEDFDVDDVDSMMDTLDSSRNINLEDENGVIETLMNESHENVANDHQNENGDSMENEIEENFSFSEVQLKPKFKFRVPSSDENSFI